MEKERIEFNADRVKVKSSQIDVRMMEPMTDDFEALLSVPMDIIFREIMQTQIISGGNRANQRTFLFSKSEVTTLLRVSMLAAELSTTMIIVYEALDRARKGNMYRHAIIEANNNGSLRTLLPIIEVHLQTVEDALGSVTSSGATLGSISRILEELDECAIELSKFSETNFNMADQLDWMTTGQGSILSREKRAIAEIEEAVCERISQLKSLAIDNSDDKNGEHVGDTNTKDDNTDVTKSPENDDNRNRKVMSMKDLCCHIFKQKEKVEYNLNTSSSEHSQSQITAAEVMTSLSKDGK